MIGNMMIRYAETGDLDEIAAVEAACFPESKAATWEQINERISAWPDHFWLLIMDGRLVSFIDGMASDDPDLTDEMYADAGLHRRDGAWQMIFGVCTLPEYRGKGYASMLMERVIEDSRTRRRKGIVLTCLERMVPFYRRFGFAGEGTSESLHGGVRWIQMRKML